MTQQATTTIQQAANGGQVATQRKPVDIKLFNHEGA